MDKQAIIEELLKKGIYKHESKQLYEMGIEELQKLLKEDETLKE